MQTTFFLTGGTRIDANSLFPFTFCQRTPMPSRLTTTLLACLTLSPVTIRISAEDTIDKANNSLRLATSFSLQDYYTPQVGRSWKTRSITILKRSKRWLSIAASRR
ncbi:hypothetical protein CFF91_15390 [Salmonella enterica]|nr:hypothetical protein [Salmonella enterica]EDC7491927.1 hypothetical protein [Salmonella enterica]